jgi:hypothetical protein
MRTGDVLMVLIFLLFLLLPNSILFASDSTDQPDTEYVDSYYYRNGLSLGASTVFRKEHGLGSAGFLETVYENFASENNLGFPSGLDQEVGVVRGVGFLGYRFTDRLVINSELRFDRDLVESRTGEFSVDSAYVDYAVNEKLSLRGGLLLVPMGIVNEFHAPNEYLGTHLALADIDAIPTVWHAVGGGIAGHLSILDYRVYVLNSFNLAGFTINGPRDGREISWDTIKTPMLMMRFDGHLFKGFLLGGGMFFGKSKAFGTLNPTDQSFHTNFQEAHLVLNRAGWIVRAEYAKLYIEPSEILNIALGTSGFNGVGSRMIGGTAEAGYNIFHYKHNGTVLMPYYRAEEVNPQDALPPKSVALGLLKNLTVDHPVFTYGIEYRPIPKLIIKADYQKIHAEKVDYGVNRFNIGVSYTFYDHYNE